MHLCKFLGPAARPLVGVVHEESVTPLPPESGSLASILASNSPKDVVDQSLISASDPVALSAVDLLPPIDEQEVWAAGVTYKRSQHARMEESEQAASFYDLVYEADRPELFLKATPHRVVGHLQPIRVRYDTAWCVPEPEMTLVLSPSLRIVGFTVGNDVSARDIEGENPLYLPQAKVYDQCAAIGPWITLAEDWNVPLADASVVLTIERDHAVLFNDETNLAQMHRGFEDLVDWLGRDNSFPNGAFLMTGTGVVPDDLTLEAGDRVSITITGIGTLTNPVVKGAS